jgi:hypothetical protein
MSPWVWVVIIVVVLVVIGLVASRSRAKRLDDRREEAASLRGAAEEHRSTVQQHEVSASTSEAEARLARDEAEVKAAHARELEAQAARDREKRDEALATHEDHLRRADAVDPDVNTDDEGYRLDDEGRRIEERSGQGAGAAGAGAVAAGAASRHAEGDSEREDQGDLVESDRGRDGTDAEAREDDVARDARTDERLDEQQGSATDDSDLLRDARTGEPLDDDGYSMEDRAQHDHAGSRDEAAYPGKPSDDRVDDEAAGDPGARTGEDYTGSHRAEPAADVRPGERGPDGMEESETGEDREDREVERPSWQERARDRADDIIGRRDTDGDGRRG